MILPGLISIAFYKHRPTRLQIALGLVSTIALSALLGYLQLAGSPQVWQNVVIAAIGGVILYLAILAYILYRYQPRRAREAVAVPPVEPP